MATFDQFEAQWLTNPPSKVADPLLAGDHPYQCVSFVKQGLADIDGLSMANSWWGNAIDYWTKTNPAILATRIRIETQEVVKGDIVILRTAGAVAGDFSGYGHIGFATGNVNSSQFELLEQNGQTGAGDGGPGDCIRTRWIAKSRIAGVLRSSTPPSPPAPKYTVVENYPDGKLIQLNKDTNLWGMNYDFNFMVDHPVEAHSKGEVWTVTNKVHHEDGYDYYRREGQVDGFNVLDCDDYTPPPPPPYVPPTGAAPYPGNGTVYEVVVPLQGYQSGTQAGNHSGLAAPVEPGTYYVFRYHPNTDQLINITKDKNKPGWWINNADNVVPEPEPVPVVPTVYVGPRTSSAPPVTVVPVPTTTMTTPVVEPTPIPPEADTSWMATYRAFYPGPERVTQPKIYQVNQAGTVSDMSNQIDTLVDIRYKQQIHVYGTFSKDDMTYYRIKLKRDLDFKWWFAVPQMHDNRAVLTLPAPSWLDRIFHRAEQFKAMSLKSIFKEDDVKYIDGIINSRIEKIKHKETK